MKYKQFQEAVLRSWNVGAGEIQEIVRACNALNAKGIRRIALIESASVDLKPFAFFAPTIAQIPLKPSKSWKNIAFSKKSASFDEPRKNDRNHGDYYDQSLKFTIHGDSVALTEFSWLTANKPFAALVTDENGMTKFVPKLYLSSRLIKSERTNGYEYTLQNRSRYTARIVENSADGNGGSNGSGAVLKSNTPLQSLVRDGDLVHLQRTDGGSFVADGIPLGNFSFQIKILPSNEIVNNGGTNYGDLIICGSQAYFPSPTVSLIISHADPTPIFDKFQYGT